MTRAMTADPDGTGRCLYPLHPATYHEADP